MTDALDAVIDAALERALLDADDARQYFALAGALRRGRSATPPDAAASPRPERDGRDRERPTSPAASPVLRAALLTTAAAGALGSIGSRDLDPEAWSPDNAREHPHGELIAAGAAAACRRFDVDPGTVAVRSGISPERLARLRTDGDVTPESE